MRRINTRLSQSFKATNKLQNRDGSSINCSDIISHFLKSEQKLNVMLSHTS